jgi:hypothetical protein
MFAGGSPLRERLSTQESDDSRRTPGRHRLLGHSFGCGVSSLPLAAESVSWNVFVAPP